jgi:hypothetical protein
MPYVAIYNYYSHTRVNPTITYPEHIRVRNSTKTSLARTLTLRFMRCITPSFRERLTKSSVRAAMPIPADRSTSPADDEGTGRPRYSTVKMRIKAFHLRSVGISSTLASSCTHRHRGIEQDRETGYVIEFGWRMRLTPRVCQTRGNGLAIRCRIDTPLSKNCRIEISKVRSAFNPSIIAGHACTRNRISLRLDLPADDHHRSLLPSRTPQTTCPSPSPCSATLLCAALPTDLPHQLSA